MGLKIVRSAILSVLAMGGLSSLAAQPMLRLVSAAVGPLSIAPGANGANQTVQAYNAGNGTLAPSLSSSVSWITPSVGASGACPATVPAASCIPLVLALNTASLAASATAYTGIVTVTAAPGTVDAPQTITVTVYIGGAVPSSVNVYVAPGGTANVPFTTSSYITSTVTTQDPPESGHIWLSLLLSGAGSAQFTYPYTISVTPLPGNTAGNTYTGAIVTSGSAFAPDNKTIAVTMNVTTLPIAQPSATQIAETLAVGAPADYYAAVVLSNPGQGTLTISGAAATGSGISTLVSGTAVYIKFDPTGLTPNTYTGSVSITSNAVNSPTVIPVTFQVVAAAAPTVFYHGVVDDAVFGASGFTVTQGDVIALFGEELSFTAPASAPPPPLPVQLGGAQVLVNGQAVPMYFSSYGQINFQMPVDAPAGTALVQVQTNGQISNTVSVNVGSRAPRLLLLSGGYGAIVDASQGNGYNVLPLPSTITYPGFTSAPAAPGDVLTIYAIGLGPTSPSVATGQPAPAAEPLARLTATPTVVFLASRDGLDVPVTAVPAYAGLSPNYAGLYQVNVKIPGSCPSGVIQVSLTFPDSTKSNSVSIQVQ